MTSEFKPPGYYAFDIERTGPTNDDVTFGFGAAFSSKNGNITKGNVCLRLRSSFEIENKISWEDIWTTRGWDKTCYDEFWSKHLNMLDFLQDPSKVNLVDTISEFTKFINDSLEKAEALHSPLNLVVDTVAFDGSWVNNLLVTHEFKGLTTTRKGEYRSGFEVDSYIMGALDFTPETDYQTLKKHIENEIDVLNSSTVVHDHNPENDATSILIKFLSTITFCSRKRERE